MRASCGVVLVTLTTLTLSAQAPNGKADPTLAECVKLAAAAAAPNRIFLWLGPIEQAERTRFTQLLNGHVNSLSTETEFVRLAIVNEAKGALLMIEDWTALGWTQTLVDKLAAADPHFHANLETVEVKYQNDVPWEGGRWKDGKDYEAGSFTYRKEVKGAKVVKTVPPAWLLKVCAADINRIENAGAKFFHGGWFFWQTLRQEDRDPGYYDFLGITDLKAFELLAGYDAKVAKAAKRREILEAVAVSAVGQQTRRIEIEATTGIVGQHGPIMRTHDFRQSKDRKNVLRVLKKSDLAQGEATEVIASLPNGLPLSGLFSLPDGKRQASAPDFVGPDPNSHNNDGRIHVHGSCWRGCHGPNQYVMPVKGWARNLFQPPLKLKAVNPEDERELRSQYLSNLERPLEASKVVFDNAIKDASGLDSKEFAKAFRESWKDVDWTVDKKRAARDLGISEKVMLDAFRKYLVEHDEIDNVLGAFLRNLEVPVEQWQEVYHLAQEIVLGIYSPKKKAG